jgi:5-methylcytosine-specific restriction enzyme A
MSNAIELIEEFSKNFLSERTAYVKGTQLTETSSHSKLVKVLPDKLAALFSLPKTFKVKGSIGSGNMAEIPWIGFFDTSITTSAQSGFYIVILFKADMSGFYISLNQGWTQYQEEYGIKKGKVIIKENAVVAQNSLKTISSLNKGVLALDATGTLGKGYELGNIASSYFDLTSTLQEIDLLQEFRDLLASYSELKGMVGIDILNIKTSISEESYQSAVQSAESKTIEAGPVKRKSQKPKGANSSYPRDARISKVALEEANFKCEVEGSHLTFVSKSSGQQFVEAHHLVPMEYQSEFSYSIDVPENIVALCPNCHRKIHLSVGAEQSPLIDLLFSKRLGLLKARGIIVDSNKTHSFYK